MFLIMSGAYVDNELQSEFGKIPPSFLPLGNRRLFHYQIKLAPKNATVYLSIPKSYKISKTDENWLTENNVNLIRSPDGLSLGASLAASLNLSEHSLATPLHVLFGDTLFEKLPSGENIIGVSTTESNYNWATISSDNHSWLKTNGTVDGAEVKNVVSGYFKFSLPRQLLRYLTESKWSFSEGLNRYHKNVSLVSSHLPDWLDFGHINTYYRSKAHFTTQRSFNELKITPDYIEKSSIKNSKIAAEANWFETLPFSLRGFIPQYLGASNADGKISYQLEYLHQTALNELFVFSDLPVHVWVKILSACTKFLKKCKLESAPTNFKYNDLSELFVKKTESRIDEYCLQKSLKMSDTWNVNGHFVSLQKMLNDSKKHLPSNIDKLWGMSVLHGDFCFSNILYDFRSNSIKTIDPRGTTPSGEITIYGDVRYDIAKLSHSILGMYDWIIAGYYSVDVKDYVISFKLEISHKHYEIQQRFIELIREEFGISAVSLMAMQIQLFLSMLPLHRDDENRQNALFANAFRLYEVMKRLEK